MSIPHHFPSLVDGPVQAVLISGAGLSAPNLPIVDLLQPKLESIASGLDVALNGDFYDLAESVLDNLKKNGNTDPESRLWLAEELGILDNRCWFGEIGVPLSGNTPRHRALARFVVEGRLRAIISLNWDALLEAALDSVGLTERDALPRPWKITKYASVVDEKSIRLLAQAHIFPVIKPHGCVRDLERIRNQVRSGDALGSVTFKLTSTDITSNQDLVFDNVKSYISSCPLVGVGWSASEEYLRRAIIEIAQQVQRSEPDPFTLIGLQWESGHSDIAKAYGKSKAESFAQVSEVENPTTDNLLQWLQARYALKRMIVMVPSGEQAHLKQLLKELDQPVGNHPLVSLADCWLPTWIRICWRAGAMQGVDPQTNKPIGPFEIPITPRDAHIPLTGMSTERCDLRAAARLFAAFPKQLNRFRFDLYPGGILDMDNQYLYLPLPGWKTTVFSSDLAALKPFVEALKGLGYVKKIFLLWLNSQEELPDLTLQKQLEAQFRRLMPLVAFASHDSVSWIDLEKFKQGMV